jgi:hypothetical protein
MSATSSASYRVCDAVLRNRRFGTSPSAEAEEAEEEGFDLSFLGNLVSGLAAPLPIAVSTDLLGVPDADSGGRRDERRTRRRPGLTRVRPRAGSGAEP